MASYHPRFEVSEPQASALLAVLNQLTPEQMASLLPETRENLTAAYHRIRSELSRSLYCR